RARFAGGVAGRFGGARLEDLVWEGLGAAATLQQLDNFIAEFPQGAHAKAAADRRATLGQEETANREEREQRARETEAWAAASRSGDAAALAAFLDEWPRSTYADTAGARIRALARPPTRRGLLGLGAAAGVAVGGGVIWSLQPRRRLIRSLVEPSHTPHSVVFSRDGRTVLSGGGSDTTLALWDVDTGKKLRTFAGHSLTVASVALSHDGRVALSGSWDHTLKLWEVTTGKELHTFEGHTVTITSVALSPDGLAALSGNWDHTLKLWELATGKKLRTFTGHRDGVYSVAFSLGGCMALSGSLDHTLKLWEVATAKELRTFIGHSGAVNSVAFSGDGRTALSGSEDTTLKLWEVATGKELRTFTGHSGSVYSVAFSP